MDDPSPIADRILEENAPDVRDLVVELLTSTEDGVATQPAVLDELCRRWPSRAAALRVAVGNLDATGWLEVDSLPDHVGEFKPVERLGGGGMGVVLLAEQPGLERRVAVKLLRADELLRDGAKQRFQRESMAIARLAHPNIVAVHSVGLDHGVPFLVMDYIEGTSLDRVVAAQHGRAPAMLSPDDMTTAISADLAGRGIVAESFDDDLFAGTWIDVVLRIARDVAAALAHAHAKGVLHRDVKPSNIMLTADGRVQLVDFGLATMLDSDRVTRSGSMVGSLPYMAPEEFDPGYASTASSDVYSLGVTLYELLLLELPFPGRGTARLRKDIEEGCFVRARGVNPAISSDLEAVLETACSREIDRRYASASALAADLTALLEGRPVAARSPSAWRRLKNWARRRPEKAALGTLVGVVAIGGPALYGYMRSAHADEVVEINRQLTVALAAEENARAVADRHFGRSIDALERVTSRMAQDGLEDEPRMLRARLEIAEDGLELLNEIQEERPDHPDVLATTGQFHVVRGEVLLDLGQIDAGLESLQQSLAILEGLTTALPDNLTHRRGHAVALAKVAGGLAHHRRGAEGVVLYQKALLSFESLNSGSADIVDLLGDTRASLAAALLGLSRFEESEVVIEAALPTAREAVDARGSEASPHRILAKLYQNLGTLQAERGDDSAGALSMERSSDAFRAALSLKSGSRSLQSKIVLTEIWRAEVLSRLGRHEEALTCLAAASELNEDLRRRFPAAVRYDERQSTVLNATSFAESNAGNEVAAVDLGEQALQMSLDIIEKRGDGIRTLEGLNLAVTMANLSARMHESTEMGVTRFERARAHSLAALQLIETHDPDLNRSGRLAHLVHYNLVMCAAGSDDLQAAGEAMERFAPLTGDGPRELNLLARGWCGILFAHDRAGTPKGPTDLAYEAAIGALERGVDAGLSNYGDLVSDKGLDPLRSDPRFTALVARLAPTD